MERNKYANITSYVFGILLACTGIVLIALQNKPIGYTLLLCTGVAALLLPNHIRKHWLLLLPPLAILGLVPINTAIDIPPYAGNGDGTGCSCRITLRCH